MCDGLCVLGSRKGCDFLLSLAPPGRWSAMHTALWFSAHSIMKLFPFSSTSMERSARLADVVFSSISPQAMSHSDTVGLDCVPPRIARLLASLKLLDCGFLTLSHTRRHGI